MKVTFDYLDEFARGAKALRKKYPSFESDYEKFLEELEKNPFSGESLGLHTYKYRMAIASKGKGKSGGARVIKEISSMMCRTRFSLSFASTLDS